MVFKLIIYFVVRIIIIKERFIKKKKTMKGKNIFLIVVIAIITSLASVWGYNKLDNYRLPMFESKDGALPVNYASFKESGNSRLAQYDLDFTAAAEAATPATVHIKTLTKARQLDPEEGGGSSPFDEFFGPFGGFFGNPGRGGRMQPEQRASGSGAIISKDGYIVTNNHVVQGADNVSVTTADKKTYKAKVVGTDPSTDLAVLKIEGNNFPYIVMGNSDDVRLGQWVLAIGYPLSLDVTVTAGIVSAMGRSININQRNMKGNTAALESFIQTDAAVNQGNSGGPLVNLKGQLIGVNSALASPTGSYAGYSYAIPINLVKKAVDDLVKYGAVQRGYLGISYGDIGLFSDEQKKELKIDKFNTGLYVSGVGGAAEAAGLKKGDVITKVDGVSVRSSAELSSSIGSKKPGDKITMEYVRNNKTQNATATLRKDLGNIGSEVAEATGAGSLGATLKPIDAASARRVGISSGVQVSELKDGILRKAGVANGFIIISAGNTAVKTPEDLNKIMLAAGKNRNSITIKGIYPDGDGYIYGYNLDLRAIDAE